MIRKSWFVVLSIFLVLMPILGAGYLYHVLNGIDQQFESRYDLEEIIEQIQRSEDLDALKSVALYIYLLQMKVIDTQHRYAYRILYFLLGVAAINGLLAIVLYREYLRDKKDH